MTTKLKHWLKCNSKNIENNDFNQLFFQCPNSVMEELIDTLRTAEINIPSHIYDYGKCVIYLNDLFEYVELSELHYFSDELNYTFYIAGLTKLYDKQLLDNKLYANCYCYVKEVVNSISGKCEMTITYRPPKSNIKILVDYT